MPRGDLAPDRSQHHLPPGARWAKPYRCMHEDDQGRAGSKGSPQRCACSAVVMGTRCPDCEQVY